MTTVGFYVHVGKGCLLYGSLPSGVIPMPELDKVCSMDERQVIELSLDRWPRIGTAVKSPSCNGWMSIGTGNDDTQIRVCRVKMFIARTLGKRFFPVTLPDSTAAIALTLDTRNGFKLSRPLALVETRFGSATDIRLVDRDCGIYVGSALGDFVVGSVDVAASPVVFATGLLKSDLVADAPGYLVSVCGPEGDQLLFVTDEVASDDCVRAALCVGEEYRVLSTAAATAHKFNQTSGWFNHKWIPLIRILCSEVIRVPDLVNMVLGYIGDRHHSVRCRDYREDKTAVDCFDDLLKCSPKIACNDRDVCDMWLMEVCSLADQAKEPRSVWLNAFRSRDKDKMAKLGYRALARGFIRLERAGANKRPHI